MEPWNITETEFRVENNYRNETTFALSNGYIGTRGTFEESYDFDIDTGLEGNFINGFYESEEIRYGEANFGSPLHSQSLLNLPNAKKIRLYAGGEEFHIQKGTVSDYSRVLRMRDGILERNLVYTTPGGKQMRIQISRFVSFRWKNIMEIRYCVTPLNFSGELTFVTGIEGNVENHTRKTNPIVDYGPFGRRLEPTAVKADGDSIYYEAVTKNSRLTAASGCMHHLEGAHMRSAPAKKSWLCPLPIPLRQSRERRSVWKNIYATVPTWIWIERSWRRIPGKCSGVPPLQDMRRRKKSRSAT